MTSSGDECLIQNIDVLNYEFKVPQPYVINDVSYDGIMIHMTDGSSRALYLHSSVGALFSEVYFQ